MASRGRLATAIGRMRVRSRANRLAPHAVSAAATVIALVSVFAMAPATPSDAPALQSVARVVVPAPVQTLETPPTATPRLVTRDAYTVTPGFNTFVRGGTNHDWAKLVLLNGGWPVSDNNVTVITRWMRQENGPDNWWNRNNPLNNGWGSGGGGGTGSYPDLQTAAAMAAECLHSMSFYGDIVAALAASAPPEVTEHAIWASPWASGHYANGAHWHYTPVPVVAAPSDAWY